MGLLCIALNQDIVVLVGQNKSTTTVPPALLMPYFRVFSVLYCFSRTQHSFLEPSVPHPRSRLLRHRARRPQTLLPARPPSRALPQPHPRGLPALQGHRHGPGQRVRRGQDTR